MQEKAQYTTILGANPEFRGGSEPIVVGHILPKIGEYDFKWVVASVIGKEYGHYGFRLHPKAKPINVHVYGECNFIARMASMRKPVRCELELVVKRTKSGFEYLFVNLYLTKPWVQITHTLDFVPAPKNRPDYVFTTKDMHGIGARVQSIG